MVRRRQAAARDLGVSEQCESDDRCDSDGVTQTTTAPACRNGVASVSFSASCRSGGQAAKLPG